MDRVGAAVGRPLLIPIGRRGRLGQRANRSEGWYQPIRDYFLGPEFLFVVLFGQVVARGICFLELHFNRSL